MTSENFLQLLKDIFAANGQSAADEQTEFWLAEEDPDDF